MAEIEVKSSSGTPIFNKIYYEKTKIEFEKFHTNMLIGANKTPIKVAFDTKGTQLFVKTDICQNCSGEGKYMTFSDELGE